MSDLYEVIEDSLTDATLPDEPAEPTPEVEATAEPTPEPVAVEPTPTEPVAEPVPETPEVKAEAPKPTDDLGIPAQSASGRENRIPYSRVTKIVDKAKKEAETRVKTEVESTYTPKIQEFETKVKALEAENTDYKGRLTNVARFEKVMLEDAPTFAQIIKSLPNYAQILQALGTNEAPTPEAAKPVAPPTDDMPQPDQPLSDGSMVYSLEGLKALNAWNRAQARREVMEEVNKEFGPIKNDWQTHQRMQALIPKVNQQIAEARTWALFNENEAAIVKVLQENPNLSLEAAYQKVVIPHLQQRVEATAPDRNKMRLEIIEELKKAPRATSAPTGATKPAPVNTSTGPRSLEEVIAEAAGITLTK